VTPGRKIQVHLSHSPAPTGDRHDVPFRAVSVPGAEGAGTGRERPATGDLSQALASELPAPADSLKTATTSSPSPAEREEHSEYDLSRTA
jgi:hypothetical protein